MTRRFAGTTVRALLALAAVAVLLRPDAAGAASNVAAPKAFVTLEQHDPWVFSYALRYGQDHLKSSPQAQFELLLASRAVLLVLPGTNRVQPEYAAIRRANPRLKVVACAETVKLLETAAKRRLPFLPGVAVEPCKD